MVRMRMRRYATIYPCNIFTFKIVDNILYLTPEEVTQYMIEVQKLEGGEDEL